MPKGTSLHIGLNAVDPNQYNGWNGQLQACEADARDMHDIAEERGFSPTVLMTTDATAQAVTDALTTAAAELEAGDMLLLTYSGHGGQVPDAHGGDEGADETQAAAWLADWFGPGRRRLGCGRRCLGGGRHCRTH